MRLLRRETPSELLSECVRHPSCLLKPGNDLLVPGRSDREAVLAERPHLDRGALDPQEGSWCSALPRLRPAIGHGARIVGHALVNHDAQLRAR